jgi:hypothetical protein
MCNYCGCREFPVIARLSAEHVEIAEAAGGLSRAISAGEESAPGLLHRLVGLLSPHTSIEESTLFRELETEPEMADAVTELCAEHTHIHGVLGAAARDGIDPAVVLPALERLHRHIDKEEYGIFPAAVVLLDMPAWDRATARL